MRKNEEQGGPDADEECNHEESDLPLGNGYAPQESPITAIRLQGSLTSNEAGVRDRRTPLSQ